MKAIVSKSIEDELRSDAEVSPRIEKLMRNARDASDFLKAISNESRLLLLCLLAERERSVGELEAILGMRQSTVSQSLARLRYDDFVTTRRDGKTVYYSIANPDVRRVLAIIYDIFCEKETDKPAS